MFGLLNLVTLRVLVIFGTLECSEENTLNLLVKRLWVNIRKGIFNVSIMINYSNYIIMQLVAILDIRRLRPETAHFEALLFHSAM